VKAAAHRPRLNPIPGKLEADIEFGEEENFLEADRFVYKVLRPYSVGEHSLCSRVCTCVHLVGSCGIPACVGPLPMPASPERPPLPLPPTHTLPHPTPQIPDEVAEIMDSPKAKELSTATTSFWFLVAALREFVASGDGTLPLSGQVGDAHSLPCVPAALVGLGGGGG
jgi:hypothetical protein